MGFRAAQMVSKSPFRNTEKHESYLKYINKEYVDLKKA
jgi:hypothetical protein